MDTICLGTVQRAVILDLRHRILRAGLPPESAEFEGDEQATHFAAMHNGLVLACLSLFPERMLDEQQCGWQLRGMACDVAHQGRGLGRQLMDYVESAFLAEQRPWLLWCNARESAVGFYQRCGWSICSDAFDVPTAGMHFKMFKWSD